MEQEEKPTGPPKPDYLGIASLSSGILAGAGCFATCIPYIGSLFMFASMAFSLMGESSSVAVAVGAAVDNIARNRPNQRNHPCPPPERLQATRPK